MTAPAAVVTAEIAFKVADQQMGWLEQPLNGDQRDAIAPRPIGHLAQAFDPHAVVDGQVVDTRGTNDFMRYHDLMCSSNALFCADIVNGTNYARARSSIAGSVWRGCRQSASK
jgi:hypothetical protein